MATFDERLQGLLSQPSFNLGVGLLAGGGPRVNQGGLGQNLGSALQFQQQQALNQQQQQANQLALQQAQAQQAQQQQLQQQLPGLLQGLGLPPEFAGLLASNPQAFTSALAQSMFSQERADPADIRAMQRLGIPLTEEGFARFQQLKESGSGGIDEFLKKQEVILNQAQIDEAAREARLAEEEASRRVRGIQETTRSSFSDLKKLIQATNVIESGLLRPGMPFNATFKALSDFIDGVTGAEEAGLPGVPTREERTAFDTFRKSSASLTEGLGAASSTVAHLQLARDASANLQTDPGAVREIALSIAERILGTGRVEGITLEQEGEIRDFIRNLSVTPIDISRMSVEELNDLDPSLLPRQIRDLAERRMDVLTGQTEPVRFATPEGPLGRSGTVPEFLLRR